MTWLSEFGQFVLDHRQEMGQQTLEHLGLTLISLGLATAVGISLGVLITRIQWAAKSVMGLVNVFQTIPSMALLGFLLPIMGIGERPAIVALFLYALLPIVRNTYTGIREVPGAVREAAQGMGLSSQQRLMQVELPLAMPVIFAGVRTSAVINVGIATLCALIAAGGLGVYIFRGIALNNSYMVLAGALPAAGLALAFDAVLAAVQRGMQRSLRLGLGLVLGVLVLPLVLVLWPSGADSRLVAGFPSEFIERGDGYTGLQAHYPGLDFQVREMDIGLMYQAVKQREVDVISGFSTDGRIRAFDLVSLEDDRRYFPPYHCAPLVRAEMLSKYPEVGEVLALLEGKLADSTMVRFNYLVDEEQQSLEQVASNWMAQQGFPTGVVRETNAPDVVVGSKNFTENLLLGTLFGMMIENHTSLDVGYALGFGGTQLAYEALLSGEIDVYPEYTGTGLLVLLKAEGAVRDSLGSSREATYDYVQQAMAPLGLKWLSPLGFNNTFALMLRRDRADELDVASISDLLSR